MDLLTVIQARTASTRLPGKVLLKLGDKTILEHVVDRLRMCEQDLGTIIVATGPRGRDNDIADICDHLRIDCFRGPEQDVLSRYHMAAQKYEANNILRVTADCPLLDPTLVDQLILRQSSDITRIGVAPKGIGEEELIAAPVLHAIWSCATKPYDREHVTTYTEGRVGYTVATIRTSDWLSAHRELRFVLDTPEDLERLQALYFHTDGHLFDLATREIIGAALAVA